MDQNFEAKKIAGEIVSGYRELTPAAIILGVIQGVIFAFFERILNRVLSALADGCPLEAKKVLPESLGAYKEVKQLF